MTKPATQRNPTIESLKDRIARDPLSRAFLQLAEEYRKEGRYQEAIDVCLEGLQRHPAYHTARISLGRTYMEGGDLENARRAFVEVLELQPENHLAAKLLAEIQKKMGDPAGAAATYRSILSYYSNDREVATLLDETLRQGSMSAVAARPATIGTPTSPTTRPASSAPPASHLPAPARGLGDRRADPSPDFRPEDFGAAATAPARDAWSAPAAGAPPHWPGPSSDAVAGPSDDDALQTNTLAELYLRQGLIDRAIEVYRGMLRVDPGNQKAARRLNELAPTGEPSPVPNVAAAAGPARATIVTRPGIPSPLPVPALVIAAGSAVPGIPSTAPPAPVASQGSARRDTIRRLERWLANFSGPAAKRAPPR